MKNSLTHHLLAALLGGVVITQTYAQTSVMTYQGRLNDTAGSVNSPTDFEFRLFNAASGGVQVGSTVVVDNAGVSNGLFTVTLDFGGAAFDGSARWLNIAVRPGPSTGAYTNVSPRQPITSTPYAIRAAGVEAAGIAGTYANAVSFSNPANSFTGNGSGLTGIHSLDASDGAPADAVFVDSIGRTGIGTLTPTDPLHVVGPSAARMKWWCKTRTIRRRPRVTRGSTMSHGFG